MGNEIQTGVEQIVRNCLKIIPGEKVTIISDNNSKRLYDLLILEIDKQGGTSSGFIMEELGERDLQGNNPLKFSDLIRKSMIESTASIYTAGSFKGELDSFRMPMIRSVNEFGLRHAHMPGVSQDLISQGMNVDYSVIQFLGNRIMDIVKSANKAHITNEAGSDFTCTFNSNHSWILDDGDISKPGSKNLPGGEIFTCVERLNGKIVVDGVLGDYFDIKYGLLTKNPVTLNVKNSRIISVTCSNQELVNDLYDMMQKDENASRIGEFAIGINIGLKKLVGNLLQDEKFPGVHVSIGHGIPQKTGANWDSCVHIDCVLTKVNIEIDGFQIMKRGKFTI